ncbi:MAG: nucleotidyltransferase domain-containing protein [Spirochaetaceae bacterium]|nr:nucleotidyltransferase domain-containing protein [Spirochaetaceae bacterium]
MYGNVILKKSNPPLYTDKIDLVRSVILESVDKDILKKVYLFGSYAYGKPNGKSDLDICVVIDDAVERTDIYLKIAKKLSDNDIILFDLVVCNEKYFYGAKNPKGVEHTIMEKGILLYG